MSFAVSLLSVLLVVSVGSAASAQEAPPPASAATSASPRVQSVVVERTAEAAGFTVKLSGPLAQAPLVRVAGGFLTLELPGATMDEAKRDLDARRETAGEEPLFEKAFAVRRADGVLLAVRSADATLAARARVELDGARLRWRLYRSLALAKAADHAAALLHSLTAADAPRALSPTPAAPPAARPATKDKAPIAASTPALLGVGGPSRAAATAGVATPKTPADATPRTGAQMTFSLRAAAVLGFLFIVIAGAVWYVRRAKGGLGRGGKGPIRIIAAQSILGQKRHILLVEVHGERLLLGSAEGSVSLLARIDSAEESEAFESRLDTELRATQRSDADPATSIFDKLKASLTRRPSQSAAPSPRARTSGELARYARSEAARGDAANTDAANTDAEPARDVSQRTPAWSVALSERGGQSGAAEAASSTAELIRRKLAELNRA